MTLFNTQVRLYSNASPDEVYARLLPMVAAPFSLAAAERRRPWRGRITLEGGRLSWRHEGRYASCRTLNFSLRISGTRTELAGEYALQQSLKIGLLIFFGWVLIPFAWIASHELTHHAGWRVVGREILFMALGLSMGAAIVWIAYLMGRRRDRDMIRLLRAILASEDGAELVHDLLSPPRASKDDFLDPPQ